MYGLYLLRGEVRDNFKSGVLEQLLEPLVVKVKALKSETKLAF